MTPRGSNRHFARGKLTAGFAAKEIIGKAGAGSICFAEVVRHSQHCATYDAIKPISSVQGKPRTCRLARHSVTSSIWLSRGSNPQPSGPWPAASTTRPLGPVGGQNFRVARRKEKGMKRQEPPIEKVAATKQTVRQVSLLTRAP